MSEFSLEVRSLLDNTVVPEMRELLSEIVAIEPYSYRSTALTDKFNKLESLTALNDYLEEYAEGQEEVETLRLIDLSKIAGKYRMSSQPGDFIPPSTTTTTEAIFSVVVDGVPFDGNISAGYHTITIEYHRTCDFVKIVLGQKVIGAKGNKVTAHNVYVSSENGIVMKAYADGNVLLATAMLSYTDSTPGFTLSPTYINFNQKTLPSATPLYRTFTVINGNAAAGTFTVVTNDSRLTPLTTSFNLAAGQSTTFILEIDISSLGVITNKTVTVTETISGEIRTATITGLTIEDPLTGTIVVTADKYSHSVLRDGTAQTVISILAVNDAADVTITSTSTKVSSISVASGTIAANGTLNSTIVLNTSVVGVFTILVTITKTNEPLDVETVSISLTVTEKPVGTFNIDPASYDLTGAWEVGDLIERAFTVTNLLGYEETFYITPNTTRVTSSVPSLTIANGSHAEFVLTVDTTEAISIDVVTTEVLGAVSGMKKDAYLYNVVVAEPVAEITKKAYKTSSVDTGYNVGTSGASYEVDPVLYFKVEATAAAYPLMIRIDTFIAAEPTDSGVPAPPVKKSWIPLAIHSSLGGDAQVISGVMPDDTIIITEDSEFKVSLLELREKYDYIAQKEPFLGVSPYIFSDDIARVVMDFEGDTTYTEIDLIPYISFKIALPSNPGTGVEWIWV